MKRIFGGVLLVLVLVPGTSLAQRGGLGVNLGEQGTVEFEVRRWRNDLVSELRLSTPDSTGTDFDPVLDLGLPPERAFDYHFAVRIAGRIKARGNWFRVRYDADTIAARDLQIAGATFPAGTTLSSMLELEHRRGGLQFDLLQGTYGFVGVTGEWARFSAKNSYESPEASASPATLRMDLPVFGVASRIYLTPALAVSVEATGMKREATGVMTDLDGSVTYNAIPSLAFTYGYRNSYNRFKSGEPESRAIYRLRGQYFGVSIRF